MKVVKEKVLGMRGCWVIKGRIVEYWTKEQGRFNRPEVLFEKVGTDDVGFSLEDLAAIQQTLLTYARENLSPL